MKFGKASYEFLSHDHRRESEPLSLQARTFDGLQFEYHPDECWAVATMHRAGGEEGLVQVRRRSDWEAQVVWRREGLLLHITNSQLLVRPLSLRFPLTPVCCVQDLR